MICEKCNSNISDTAKFCPKCGAKVEMAKAQDIIFCPKCGTPHQLTAKFCRKDGTPLQKAITPEEKEKPPEKMPEPEKPKDVIICPKCGTSNSLTAKFCKKDGTLLKEEIKPAKIIERKPKEVAPTKARKTLIWIAVSVFIIILAGAGSYLYFSGQIGKKPTEITAVPEVPKPSEAIRAPEEVEKPIAPQEPETKIVSPPMRVPEVPKPSEAIRAPEEVEKPIAPQEPETEIVSPPMPAPELPKPSVDIARVERDLNMTLRNRGLSNVYAKVDKDLTATLKGTVDDPRDKILASNIAESFREIKEAKNEILVAKKPPPPYEIDPAKLEGDINRALRNAGLRGVIAEVSDDLEVTLKGSVGSNYEKDRAFEIAKRFKEAKRIRDVIFVVEQ